MRRSQLTLAVVVALCIAVVAVAFARLRHQQPLSISLNTPTIEADGCSTTVAELRGATNDLTSVNVSSSDPSRARIESLDQQDGRVLIRIRAGVLPGETRIVAKSHGISRQVTLQLSPSVSDEYSDGTPDFLRLSDPVDSDAFRRWFAFLTEAQYFNQPRLAPEITDCASLVRFAYREALREHDDEWAATQALPRLPAIPNVRQYQYPHTPLGAALFRTRPGPLAREDLQRNAFAQFADAKTLRQFNMHFVSQRVTDARTGDVLFFRQDSQRSPYHAMVYLEKSSLDGTAEPLLVYHTGPIESRPGEIRRPTLQLMVHYPDARWRPVPENRAFLGIYRWNILRGSN